MNLFGPTLVAGLPAWPPAADDQTWRIRPSSIPLWHNSYATPESRGAVRFRPLDEVEWLELAARLGATFSAFDYEILRAGAARVLQMDALETMTSETEDIEEVRDEFWSDTAQSWVHTASVVDRLAVHCRAWCRAQVLNAEREEDVSEGSYVPMVNQYGRVYLCRGIQWEECE